MENKICYSIIMSMILIGTGLSNEKTKELLMLTADTKIESGKYANVSIEEKESSSSCVYFTFTSKNNLNDIIKSSKLLVNAKPRKISLEIFLDDYWVTPKLPKIALNDAQGITIMWQKGSLIYDLYLAVVANKSNPKEFDYFGCCMIRTQPTNGTLPELQFTEEGERK